MDNLLSFQIFLIPIFNSFINKGYPEFGRHLNGTGRPMIYSCSWPVYQIYAGISVNKKIHCLISKFPNLKKLLIFSQISHQLLSIAICGETLMIFKTHGHHLKVSLTTMATTKIILFQMPDQDIV